METDAQMNTGGVLKVSVRYSDNISQLVEVHLLKPGNQDEWISAVKAVIRLNSDCVIISFCAHSNGKKKLLLVTMTRYL